MKVARQQYRKVKLDAVKPHPRNPRRGSLEAIAESLEANDFYGAIVVQKGTGYVLAGNHRLLAAKEAGAKELPAMVVDCDDETALRILLADNATSDKAEYDTPELHALLKEIGQEAGTLEGTGWGFDDFRALEREVAKLTNGDVGADEVPEPPAEPRSKLGEIYELGPHRLMCGDATDAEQVAELLAGAEPILLATDPPYGVDLEQDWRDKVGVNRLGKAEGTGWKDERADWSEAFELVPSIAVAYVWHASRHVLEVAQGLERIGLPLCQQIIWKKSRFALSRQHYHWQHEPCWYARKPGAPWLGGRDQSTVWEVASPKHIMAGSDEERLAHPTQKPVALYTRVIENHLNVGEVVYDPFLGSGSAIIGAELTSRRCLGIEIDPRYCDVIRDRYEAFVAALSLAA